MPIRITESQARRLKLNTEGAVAAPEPRKKAGVKGDTRTERRANPGGSQSRTGYFGGRLHRWEFSHKVDSWVSGCGLLQRSEIIEELPEGLQAQADCECLSKGE